MKRKAPVALTGLTVVPDENINLDRVRVVRAGVNGKLTARQRKYLEESDPSTPTVLMREDGKHVLVEVKASLFFGLWRECQQLREALHLVAQATGVEA